MSILTLYGKFPVSCHLPHTCHNSCLPVHRFPLPSRHAVQIFCHPFSSRHPSRATWTRSLDCLGRVCSLPPPFPFTWRPRSGIFGVSSHPYSFRTTPFSRYPGVPPWLPGWPSWTSRRHVVSFSALGDLCIFQVSINFFLFRYDLCGHHSSTSDPIVVTTIGLEVTGMLFLTSPSAVTL